MPTTNEALLSQVYALQNNNIWFKTSQDALEYLREEIMPLLENVCRADQAKLAEVVEFWTYQNIIKIFEHADHYDACFSLIDGPLQSLGRRAVLKEYAGENSITPDWRPRKYLFFIHNLSSERAHAKLFCDLIQSYLKEHPNRARTIRIAGLVHDTIAPCYLLLRQEYGISLSAFPAQDGLYTALRNLAKQVSKNIDERCIVVAVPLGLSYMSGLLHPERLAWLSMKFELSAFSGLAHRYSFGSGRRTLRRFNNTIWYSAPPLFAIEPVVHKGHSLPHSEQIDSFQQIFFTVNREEKIRNTEFLEAVTRILLAVPTACFAWTGMEALPEITSWFNSHGVADRCFFVGWIEPDALLSRGHIFLDTPKLSGAVAAKSMACGIPVISFKRAQSWVNFFHPLLEEELAGIDDTHPLIPVRRLKEHGLLLECSSLEEYVEQAVTLAYDEHLRQLYAEGIRAFAQYYFMRNREYACMHFENFAVTQADLPSP